KALFDFLKELEETGLLKSLIKAGVGALGSAFTPSPTGAGGDFGNSPVMTQHGGVFSGAQWRVLGEAGPEAVIPLEHGAVPVRMSGEWGGGADGVVNIFVQAAN